MDILKKHKTRTLLLALCATAILAVSCQTARNGSQRSAKYSKQRTRYKSHWNSSSSQSTTYYIKKHNTPRRASEVPVKPKPKNKKKNKY
ncbi:MAG: hypothetical protein SPL42_01710 [Bacteroidales bacterium]|nr:hypothetical protein [Bacteroidales bacterium]